MKWGCTAMMVLHFCVQNDSKAHRKKKQEVSDVFKSNGLKFAIKANRKIVNFLDMTLFNSAKCKQEKRISLKTSMQTVFSRDSNVHLLLDHTINQKTETWRMIIRQQ